MVQKNKNKIMKYKCGIIKLNEKCFCFVEKKDGTISDGFCITDYDNIYQGLGEHQICAATVLFKKEENVVEFESLNEKFEDVFFVINDQQNVTISEDENKNVYVSMLNILNEGTMGSVLETLFEDEDIYGNFDGNDIKE